MPSVFQLVKEFVSQLKRENLHYVGMFLLVLIVLASLAFWQFEQDLGLTDAFWWSFVTVTTVGYGDISPATPGGRIIGVLLMMLGIGFLGVITASVATVFIENRLLERKGMKSIRSSGHFILCGWNVKGVDIVAELRADEKSQDAPIVLIAELDEAPVDDAGLRFISGPIDGATLEKANAGQAQAVMMLSDEQVEPRVRDAKTILDTLTVKSLYPQLYVCVELMDSKNVDHCQRAKADEIVVVGELSTNLLVQAALDHGITRVITELVSNRYGNELYKISPPPAMIGRAFIDILCELKKEYGVLCLGVQNRIDHTLTANPAAEYCLGPEDELLVIAGTRPDLTANPP